ncbi:MAG: hypothetical protein HYX34_14895 [Actinobacteria bacterium]|nr:hypothetical protein [Actinomycetota bacterium]
MAVAFAVLALACGSSVRSDRGVTSAAADPGIPSQRVCGTEFPLAGPADLAARSERVLIGRLASVEPSAVTAPKADPQDPRPDRLRFTALSFEVLSNIKGGGDPEVSVLTVQDAIDERGSVTSEISPCAIADFSMAKPGDEFLLFLTRYNQSQQYFTLFSSSGVARFANGRVVSVGASSPISDDEAKTHLLAPLVGETTEQLRASLG